MALPTAPPPSPEAAHVLDLARREAAERGHRGIGTAHLLRAVVRAGGPEAGLLAAAGVTERGSDAALTLAVWSATGEPDPSGPPGPPVANAAVLEVLAAAGARAAAHGRAAPAVADLLAGLLDRRVGQAADMLVTLGADADRLVDALAGLAGVGAPARRVTPRDPGQLLSSAWRAARTA